MFKSVLCERRLVKPRLLRPVISSDRKQLWKQILQLKNKVYCDSLDKIQYKEQRGKLRENAACSLSPFHDIAIVKELFKKYLQCNLFLGRS